MFEQADSVDEWLRIARSNRDAAYALVYVPSTRNIAWERAGFAAECVLKASIMAKERLNRFPPRALRRDLYDHDLGRLSRTLGMEVMADDDLAPYWQVVLQWRREHTYVAGEMPLTVVRELLDAVFSDDGVVPWVCRSYLGSYMTPEQNIWRR
ncbi:hypothetical protein ACFSJ2_01475 [Pseudochelatococcus lubricantis]